jgi:ferritin-like protein
MDNLLQFFAYEHLSVHLQAVSKPFGDLARNLAAELPKNPESTVALRKLLEAKDCAVRAILFK